MSTNPMNILFITPFWPSYESSGVSLAASMHVNFLINAGYQVSIVGSHSSVLQEPLPVMARYFVPSRGSESLYSLGSVNAGKLRMAIINSKPNLIVVETWQTTLTDKSIDIAHEHRIPILMISHGVSVHPFTMGIFDRARALCWLYYKYILLPMRINKIKILTVLDMHSMSSRFYDRDIAKKVGKGIVQLSNCPKHTSVNYVDLSRRKFQILQIGYYSRIKNQIAAINIFSKLPEKFVLCLIGRRRGNYYKKCVALVHKLNVDARVRFLEDGECEISHELSNSIVYLSTSITEALPISILESMAAGTPFVANSVGAIPSLKGGILCNSQEDYLDAISTLTTNQELWQRKSNEGRDEILRRHNTESISKALVAAVEMAIE